jgi:hypothetical protein
MTRFVRLRLAGAPALCAIAAATLISSAAHAAPGIPSDGRLSFGAFYSETNDWSEPSAVSDDGLYVTYYSIATNIVDEDPNARIDLYLYDRFFGVTTLLSDAPNGSAGNGEVAPVGSPGRKISGDGRYVMFQSTSSNLVTGDTNGMPDTFVRDVYGSTERVSLATGGIQLTATSFASAMTTDGRKILFATPQALTAGDTNGVDDLYLYDRISKVTTLVSKRANGTAIGAFFGDLDANATYALVMTKTSLVAADTNTTSNLYRITLSNSAATLVDASASGVVANATGNAGFRLSPDGSRAAFTTSASNLMTGDTNGKTDVYVRIFATGQIVRASLTASGTQPNNDCQSPQMSTTGRYLTLECFASNLVSGDTNGTLDVFSKDLQTGTLTLVSRAQNGPISNFLSGVAVMTPDASQIIMQSLGTNLTSPDGNNAGDVFAATRQ